MRIRDREPTAHTELCYILFKSVSVAAENLDIFYALKPTVIEK